MLFDRVHRGLDVLLAAVADVHHPPVDVAHIPVHAGQDEEQAGGHQSQCAHRDRGDDRRRPPGSSQNDSPSGGRRPPVPRGPRRPAAASDLQQHLDLAALVHGPVGLGGLLQRQAPGEDAPGADLTGPDAPDQVRQEAAHGRRPAEQVHFGEEQGLPVDLLVVGDADEADVAARAARGDGLVHGQLGAHGLAHPVGAQPIGQFLDLGRTGLAALGDDDVGPELAGQRRAVLMAGEGDDPLGPQRLGGQDSAHANAAFGQGEKR